MDVARLSAASADEAVAGVRHPDLGGRREQQASVVQSQVLAVGGHDVSADLRSLGTGGVSGATLVASGEGDASRTGGGDGAPTVVVAFKCGSCYVQARPPQETRAAAQGEREEWQATTPALVRPALAPSAAPRDVSKKAAPPSPAEDIIR